ncbi:substrate-binding periplasmic protein [Vibrio profundi]|uniref:substrate-binding periplasmic protein n=1 Tax=Vibrio profundi TaxID=1774960 RepID=UPI0037359D00
MKLIARISTLMLMAYSTLAISQSLNTLTYLTEEYPPYNFSEEGKVTGIAVDLLLSASKEVGEEIFDDDIALQPWARAYRSTLIKRDTVLFSTTRTTLRENLFYWVGPIVETRIVILAKKSHEIKIENAMDLAQYRIGVIRDDVGEQLLLEAGVPRDSIQENSYAENIAQQIQKERIDLWAYEENVAKWWIATAGYRTSDYEVVHVLQEGELYFALNKTTDIRLVKRLQKGVDLVRETNNEDGVNKFDAILNLYR